MIRSHLSNPWQAAVLAGLLVTGRWTPWAWAASGLFFAACEIEAGLRKREGPRWLPAEWPSVGAPLTILFDATCVLCVGSRKRLESWRTAGSMVFVPIQSPEAKALLPGVPEDQLLGAMHVVEGGKVSSGADGWFRIMRLAPLTTAWIAWVTPLAAARPVYGWIARNRYRWFGRVCDEGTCSLHAKPPL